MIYTIFKYWKREGNIIFNAGDLITYVAHKGFKMKTIRFKRIHKGG